MKPTEILGCCKRGVSLQISTGKLTKKSENKTFINELSKYSDNGVTELKLKIFSFPNYIWRYHTRRDNRTNQTPRFSYLPRNFAERHLKSFKKKKVAGADDIPPGIIKDYHKKITKPLTYIVNLTSKSGTFPFIWNMQRLPQYIKPWI